jgi:hypothetical protein
VGRLDAEPPGQLAPVPRVVDADPGRLEHAIRVRPEAVVQQVELRRPQRRPAERPVDRERLADQRRPRAASYSRPGLQGAHQDSLRHTLLAGHEVEAVVHPVDEVHVGTARRTEHHPGSRRQPAKRVRCAVLRPAVGLHFDQPSPERPAAYLPDEQLPQQVSGHFERVPGEELKAQQSSRRLRRTARHRCNIGRPGAPPGDASQQTHTPTQHRPQHRTLWRAS